MILAPPGVLTVSALSPSFKVAALSAKFLMAVRRAALISAGDFLARFSMSALRASRDT